MYLSKLEIIGFKSFATKTSLGFDSGISAIVGPNGCGKTNIVDVIRWVLGEQRYSALRSEKMEDVIFNGTKTRKPLGMAEASLVIENTKGILPSEYTQVTIGRRVYRSGESEYLLNKMPCRLKDIQDLFMDTGMGADAYSVIELKMVESILSDKTDERRHLFEEAAGVTKYKHRRRAAYRKLESVQADLLRVNDIVAEVQKAVSSLERQAKRAEQHNEVRSRLKHLEIDLMEREYAQLHARRIPLEERLIGLRSERMTIDGSLSREERRLEELRATTTELDQQLSNAQHDVGEQSEKVNRIRQSNLIAAERRKALDDTIVRIENEKTTIIGETDSLVTGRVSLTDRIADGKQEEALTLARLEEARARLGTIEERLAAKRTELHSLSETTILKLHHIAELQAEQDRKRGRVENLLGRSARAEDERKAYSADILRLEEEIGRFLAEDKQLRRLFTEAEMKYYGEEERKKNLQVNADALGSSIIGLRTELERRSAKMEFLRGLIQSREGLSEGVKFLAAASEWGVSHTLTVGDVAITEGKFRPAIESALGELGGMMIVKSPADADRAMTLLKREDRGKATFVCLDRVPDLNSMPPPPRLPGVLEWASELVRCEPLYKNMFRFILDRVVVVADRASGLNAIGNTVGLRCVTLDGEIITGVGLMRGGSKRHDEGGGIGKHAQIEELQHEAEDLERRISLLLHAQEDVVKEQNAINIKALQDEVKRVEREMSAVEVRMAQLEFEKRRGADVITKTAQEIMALAAEASVLGEEIGSHEQPLVALKEEKADIERRIGGVQREMEILEQDWNTLSKLVNELGVTVATVKGETQNAENELKRTEDRITENGIRLERLGNEILRAQDEIDYTVSSVEENIHALNTLQDELAILEGRKKGIEDQVVQTREEIHRIEMAIKDERRRHDDSLEAMHELELRIAEIRAKSDHIVARALEEYEVSLELKSYPDGEFVDFAVLRDEIQALRERIKSLGNINFAAFEEYTNEKQRLEFLTEQRKDLLEAEKTLLFTIEEINATAQRKFLDTFGKIRGNFIETFKSLFDPGDECDLRLEEDVDPLEARIEIIAKPRGKRPTSIDLLSGGEKTLTATALLFAIYLVKPSPFCILDEVDAPLDDANIDRFTRILRKFSDNTQFIVVTHNKRTMEAANALYGVTMEEEGVSKLVTVRFNRAGVRSAELVSG